MMRERDALFERFVDPPPSSRPFVRWWWNGNCLERSEIERELDVLKNAGVGGVEINPVAMPPHEGQTPEGLVWLSSEWNEMLAFAVDSARKRGMIADLIIGTGWPFGGEFLKPGQVNQRMCVVKQLVEGPADLTLEKKSLFAEADIDQKCLAAGPALRFLRLVPDLAASVNHCSDVMPEDDNGGSFVVRVSKGRHTLYAGVWYRGTRQVGLGAPGGRGPVMDHYDEGVVEMYLQRMSSHLSGALPGGMGEHIRAMFCDSMELAGANWTGDVEEQFKKRRGYALGPYLPFVFHPGNSGYDLPPGTATFRDIVRRARHDFNTTLLELYVERFVCVVNDWCHRNGMKFRYQAYGCPWLMDMPAAYTVPDIPESNNWLFSNLGPYRHGYWTWNQYAASGGHIAGRPVISTEAMTNTHGVFRTELNDIKQADDENFVMGINHSVLHGFNYSPPEAGMPGWVRYGTYFSENNPWWRYFGEWTRYNARLSSVFQAADPVGQCAVLAPLADLMSDHGLWREPFQTHPAHRLWEPLRRNGYAVDYLHEKAIRECRADAGVLACGPMHFEVLVLAGVQSIDDMTLQQISRFVASGGRLVILDGPPVRTPSMAEAESGDRTVRARMDTLLRKYPERVVQGSFPNEGESMTPWMRGLLEQADIKPLVQIEPVNENLFTCVYRDGERMIVFFANNSPDTDVAVRARVVSNQGFPWLWDPHTGERVVLEQDPDTGMFPLALGPLESALVVMDAKAPDQDSKRGPAPETRSGVAPLEVTAEWRARFEPVEGPGFSMTLDALPTLGRFDDTRLNTFAGQAVFETEFHVPSSDFRILDLGFVNGVTCLTLNGKKLGVRWFGRHVYRVGDTLHAGKNHIRIELTTVLANYFRTLKDHKAVAPWIRLWSGPVSVGFNDAPVVR